MPARRWAVAASVALALALPVAHGAYVAPEACSDEDGPVMCTQCREGADVNAVAGLPRLNAGFAGVSNNWGWYTETWTRVADRCIVRPELGCDIAEALPVGGAGSGKPKQFISYTESLGLYWGVAEFMFFITLLSLPLWCFGRYCCCCRCKGSCCNYGSGCCGGRYPTRSRGPPCSCLGFRRNEETNEWAYSAGEVWGTRVFMWVYILCVIIFMSMGQFGGNEGVTTAMHAWTESPEGVVDLVVGVKKPVTNLVIDMASSTVKDLLQGTADAITEGINLGQVVSDLGCVISKVSNLPNVTVLVIFIDDMGIIFDRIINATVDVGVAVQGIQVQIDTINTKAGNLETTVNGVANNIDAVAPAITDTGNAVTDMVNFINDLLSPSYGVISIVNDLTSIGSQPAGRPAAQTALNTVSGDGAAAAAPGMAAGPVTDLQTKMLALKNAYAAQPNFTLTAVNMERYNARIDQANREQTLAKVNASIVNTQNTLLTLKGTAVTLNNSINALSDQVRAFDVSAVTAALGGIDSAIGDIDFTPVIGEINKVKDVPNVLPCMASMGRELLGLNKTVFEVPQSIADIVDMTDTLNSTLAPALENLDQINQQEKDFNDQVGNMNVTGRSRDMEKVVDDAIKQLDNMDVAGILGDLQKMENDIELNLTIADDIITFNTTLNGNKINASETNAIYTFAATLDTLKAMINDVYADMIQFDKGHCAAATTQYCAVDGDCAGADTCDLTNVRVKRCTHDASVICTQDSDCGAGNRCQVDVARFTSLGTILVNADAPPEVVNILNSMNGVSADGSFDTSAFNSSLNSAKQALADVDTATFRSSISDVTGALDGADLSGISNSTSDGANTMRDVKKTFTDQRKTVLDLDDTMKTVTDMLDLVRKAKGFVQALKDTFEVIFPVQLARLDKTALTAVGDTKGVGGVILEITDVMDTIANFFNDSQTLVATATNLTGDVTDIVDQLEVLDNPAHQDAGPVYFLQKLAGADMVTPEEGKGGRMNADANGNPYPGDKSCYTKECLKNWVDWFNTAPLEEVSDGSAPLPMSRVDLMGVPYIFPLLILLLAFLATLCSFCSGCCGCCCSCCSCLSISCCMPWIFLFMGPFFSIVLVFGDFCYSYENVLYRIADAAGPAMCTEQLGGVYQKATNDCKLEPMANITMAIDINGFIKGPLGGQCAGKDVMKDIFTSLGDGIKDYPSTFIDPFINGTEPVKLKPKMQAVLTRVGTSAGTNLKTFFDGLGEAIGCKAINSAYMGFREALCCETANALYWGVSSWYLIAWSMCLCGCTSSTLGIKRFYRKLWGREYKALLDEEDAAEYGATEGGGTAGGEYEMTGAPVDAGYEVPYDAGAAGGYDQGGYDQGGYEQGGYDQGAAYDASGGYAQEKGPEE